MVKPLYSTFIYMNMQVPEPSAPRREASRPLRPAELYSKLSVPAAGKSIRLLDLQALPSKKTDTQPCPMSRGDFLRLMTSYISSHGRAEILSLSYQSRLIAGMPYEPSADNTGLSLFGLTLYASTRATSMKTVGRLR